MKQQWWHGKIAYQIYPKSFCDSNGDGIGDLNGIISKLDYLKDLGVDIIWISPIYCSPMADQGYDISDYYQIDPIFGNMQQMQLLLAEAKKRDLHIVMDLVANHCSDEHPWFRAACKDPDGKYGKYFYIRDWHEGEPLPCNWRSYFGGPVWDKLPGHEDKIYLHLYHKKQPDLNWENPEVREELYRMINWWLDQGLSGFRLDAICNIKKAPFRDYPADRDDGLCAVDRTQRDAVGLLDALRELRDRTFRLHGAFTVGEVFTDDHSALPDYIGDDGVFSTIFDFSQALLGQTDLGWHARTPVTADQYKASCFQSQADAEGVGLFSNIIENHDLPRGVSHFLPEGAPEAAKKLLGGLNVLLKGLPFLYQGQELGMENTLCECITDTDDVYALGEYQASLDAGLTPEEALAVSNRYSRDNARTPFQWNDGPQAGFTTGTPWLPVNANYRRINAEEQLQRPDSLLHFYQKLFALRKDPAYAETLTYGKTIPWLPEQHNLMAYLREGSPRILVLGNFQAQPQEAALPAPVKALLLNNLETVPAFGASVRLDGWQLLVLAVSMDHGTQWF